MEKTRERRAEKGSFLNRREMNFAERKDEKRTAWDFLCIGRGFLKFERISNRANLFPER